MDELKLQAPSDIRNQALEEAALVIEQGQETNVTVGADGEQNTRRVTPRRSGNLMGLAYAESIRARKSIAGPAADGPDADHEFRNFHRSLCERFGYTHDERDWRRDQISLIEHISTAAPAQPVYPSESVNSQLVEALKAMLDTQPNANDGRAGGHQSVTEDDVAACRQARAALAAAQPVGLSEQDKLDAARYRHVKTFDKHTLLAWRGLYAYSDEAVDAAIIAAKEAP